MNAIRVDTLELRQSGTRFTKASGDMENTSRRLANLRTLLAKEEFAGISNIAAVLDSTKTDLDRVSTELKNFGRQVSKISDIYDNTERDVLNMVKSLPNFSFSVFRNNKNPASAEQSLSYQIFAEPVIFVNSGLHGESWLIKRAIDELSDI